MSDSIDSGRGTVSRETIVLASNSASRKAMLSAAAVEFDAIAADVDERALEAEMDNAEPPEIAQALAAAKAAASAARASASAAPVPQYHGHSTAPTW